MDSYSGSQPRNFISFQLGERENGQPTQDPKVLESEDNSARPTPMETDPTVSAAEPVLHVEPEDQRSEQLQQSPSPSLVSRFLATDSSGSNESCGTYITCKMAQMEETAARDFVEVTEAAQRESISAAIAVAVNPELPSSEQIPSSSQPQVIFLDPPDSDLQGLQTGPVGPSPKRSRNSVSETGSSFGTEPVTKDPSGTISVQSGVRLPNRPPTPFPLFGSQSETGHERETDSESGLNVGSTLADALKPVHDYNLPVTSEQSSVSTPHDLPRGPRDVPLGGRSRALIKEHFDNNERCRFPPGHPVVAFTESQISAVMRVVADETARASYDMLENLVYRASRLSLASRPGGAQTSKGGSSRRDSSVVTSTGRHRSSSTERFSETSGALQSNDDFGSLGYSFEHTDVELQVGQPQPEPIPGSSRSDPQSPHSVFNVDSPGLQTLAALKKEAVADRQRKKGPTKTKGTGRTGRCTTARVKTTRTCKVMKEAYFRGMEWTRTFVSGPVDPKWNKYKFYCQICKANISIYSKGAREILRHHSSEKHLRKDQRWRYEYLYKIDPYTNSRIPQVRGKHGKLLTPYELAMELPYFKDVELVDIGEKLPFYDEYMSGADHMSSSSENRARIQISVLGRFLPHYGDIDLLRNFWRDIGVVVNHQSLFTDFNWTKERLTVSIHHLQSLSLPY